ncbi:hypothetical protein RhiirA5_439047 [Rhizophagus irregularis]|uniref:Uncharacterized protein n=1 Tax=Rhizophagus irregularis TaxID=588596 RepID=A0A2N0NID0_9GLOM|nr:hypothetical protein RhiirA5_439047 [Rhizophagus irregularis]
MRCNDGSFGPGINANVNILDGLNRSFLGKLQMIATLTYNQKWCKRNFHIKIEEMHYADL